MALSKFAFPEITSKDIVTLCIEAMPPIITNQTLLDMYPDVSKRMTLQEKTKYLQEFSKTSLCPDVSKYKLLKKIGSGTFGDVFMAHSILEPSKIVAIKKIKLSNEKAEGFPVTALREIDILKQLEHDNIVKLIEVCRTMNTNNRNLSFTYCLILEYCEHDLGGVLANQMIDISDAERKCLIKQLLVGVQFMHEKNILHRDIKSANLLLNKEGLLKLADMGLARIVDKPAETSQRIFTNCVVTLWYRPPELLLGSITYGSSVDMWSVALIICEIWMREPLLQGNTETEQLALIGRLCGSITEISCPSSKNYPLFRKVSLHRNLPRKVLPRLGNIVTDTLCLDIIDCLLQLEPSQRMSASAALSHKYFNVEPYPHSLSSLMTRIRGNYYSR